MNEETRKHLEWIRNTLQEGMDQTDIDDVGTMEVLVVKAAIALANLETLLDSTPESSFRHHA